MELDPSGSGRVPLGAFYRMGAEQFTESPDYLRQTGALDETRNGRPQVLIANYLAGPSNCIAHSSYYSICCLSECEGIMSELQGKIKAPTAAPQRLVALVANIS